MLKQIITLLLAQFVAIFIFCCGFFPQKNVLKGTADFTLESSVQSESKPVFDKLVLVVIDALRSDFVFEESISNFKFVHSLINDGEAWGFTAYSNPPTVTLPRLKGITTGSTPNFLDAILNVAEDDSSSNLKEQDSWLKQFVRQGKKIRFFGDDTWLKLFPVDFFQEYEGTNSFFVSDFEQVDLNVTRHLSHQLENQNEWDGLILHYLGLDHIGHKGGSRSVFMPNKHEEMDSVIKEIYESVDEDTLVCIMGDHGMNDVGNHGGSSPGETSSALVMMSKKLKQFQPPLHQRGLHLPITTELQDHETNYDYLTKIQQVDFVPTLATLFNIPIPKNNVGIIIPDFLQLLENKIAAIKVEDNFNQLASILGRTPGVKNESISQLFEQMRDLQEILTKSATNYKYNILAIGFGMLIIIAAVALWYGISIMQLNNSGLLTLSLSLILGVAMFGSSFVEEEHQIWWWIITGTLLLSQLCLRKAYKLHLICLVCTRLIRGWNNSGQKYTYNNTIFELLKANPSIQWYLNLLTIFAVGMRGTMRDRLSFVLSFSLCALCGSYKVSWAIVNREYVPFWIRDIAFKSCLFFTEDQSNGVEVFNKALVPMAQFFFKYFIVCLAIKVSASKMGITKVNLFNMFSILLMLQSPSANIPIFFVFEVLRSALSRLFKDHYNSDSYLISLSSLILQYFTFFQFGGTNSIASIDLSNAYNGVPENYNIYLVGFMMFVSNFAPTIYWSLYKSTISSPEDHKWILYAEQKIPFLIFNCIVGVFLLIACYIFRFHLFVWSVFSPKLCYFASWNIFMNIIIECGLEPMVWAVGT